MKVLGFILPLLGPRGGQVEKLGKGIFLKLESEKLFFGPGKAEIGLGTAIFGISVKNYRGYRNSRPNPCPGDPFRDRLKMVAVVAKTRSHTRSARRCPGMPSLFLQPPCKCGESNYGILVSNDMSGDIDTDKEEKTAHKHK